MSMRLVFRVIFMSMVTIAVGNAASPATPPQSSATNVEDQKAQVAQAYGKLPLRFEANAGQTDAQVKFLSRGSGYSFFLTPQEAVLVLHRKENAKNPSHEKTKPSKNIEASVLRMRLKGANPKPLVNGEEGFAGKSNYYAGNDPKRWHTNVANYAKVRYLDVYPGIDLVYYGNQRQLEYDFVLAPGADPEAIAFHIEGTDEIHIDDNGDLVLSTKSGQVRQHKPVVYQEVAGKRREINGRYTLKGKNEIGFTLASYDRSRRLVIDPVMELGYSTFLGGGRAEYAYGVMLDASRNAYVTGSVESDDFPVANPYQSTRAGGRDVFITKINAAGNALVYSTYLGGSGDDEGLDLAVDTNGYAYVTGHTASTDFPMANAYQAVSGGGAWDTFITKLSASGNALVYSTYLGGSGVDEGYGMAVDASGNAYVAGNTDSTDFPVANAYQPAKAGSGDAFVTKLNASGNALLYSTYLGGTLMDRARDIVVDANGNAYVTGGTEAFDFPTVDACQPARVGAQEAFITKFAAQGALVFSTYLGGSNDDEGLGIAVDMSGNVYVTGETASADFPTANALQPTFGAGADAFVTKLDASGNALAYSTYLGGSDIEEGQDVWVDEAGNAYVTGTTESTDFPIANAYQTTKQGLGADIFAAKIVSSGSALLYSTYLGGSEFEIGRVIVADTAGDAYVAGHTGSADFPVRNAYQSEYKGDEADGFITKLVANPCTLPPGPGDIVGTSGNDTLTGTPGDDKIFGLGGNDFIDGLAGNDVICGGPGNDRLQGRTGDDLIDGGSGDDSIDAGDGNNVVYGGTGNDTIMTGTGSDTVDAGTGNDIINTGDGNDVVDAGTGNDTIATGIGDDTIIGGTGNDSVIAGPGNDTINAGSGNDIVNAGPGDDTVRGEAGNDLLNAVDGVSGNDNVDGGTDNDICTADAGDVVTNCNP